MSMAVACHRDPRVNLVGVALVSGAYFGLGSATNFGREDHEICLPKFPVRMMMMHGTGDEVMPYSGQNFRNQKALEHADDYWTSIDPTASAEPPFSRTYTADIARYVETRRPPWRWAGSAMPHSASSPSRAGITCGRGTQ